MLVALLLMGAACSPVRTFGKPASPRLITTSLPKNMQQDTPPDSSGESYYSQIPSPGQPSKLPSRINLTPIRSISRLGIPDQDLASFYKQASANTQLNSHSLLPVDHRLSYVPLPADRLIYSNNLNPPVSNAKDSGSDESMNRNWSDERRQSQSLYAIGRMIGSGGNGRVYEATYRPTSTPVVVKLTGYYPTEIALSREMSSAYPLEFIGFLDFFRVSSKLVIIVMENLGDEWTCLNELTRRGFSNPKDAKTVFVHIVRAAAKMRQRGFYHGDLKPENIMVHKTDFRVQLLDFGSSDKYADPIGFLGTISRAAPEYCCLIDMSRKAFSEQQEIWTLGIILFELVYGEFEKPDLKAFELDCDSVIATVSADPAHKATEVFSTQIAYVQRWLLDSLASHRPSISVLGDYLESHAW